METTYRKVKCSERLPDKVETYTTDKGDLLYDVENKNWLVLNIGGFCPIAYPSWWLEPIPPTEQGDTPERGIEETKAIQKQSDSPYHVGCQNCGITDKPLQMIPLRNDEHVVGLLLACDGCKDELYGQRFDREVKFKSLTHRQPQREEELTIGGMSLEERINHLKKAEMEYYHQAYDEGYPHNEKSKYTRGVSREFEARRQELEMIQFTALPNPNELDPETDKEKESDGA